MEGILVCDGSRKTCDLEGNTCPTVVVVVRPDLAKFIKDWMVNSPHNNKRKKPIPDGYLKKAIAELVMDGIEARTQGCDLDPDAPGNRAVRERIAYLERVLDANGVPKV